MTQSVVAQTTGIIGIAYDWRTEANRTKGSDFDLFLDKSLLGKGNFQSARRSKTATDRLDTSMNKPLTGYKESKISKIGYDGLARIDNKLDESDKIDNLDTKSMELILGLYGQIQSLIMEEFNLTPEELDLMMTDMGIGLSDLSKPQVIMEMLLNSQGLSEPSEILFDEELHNTFQKILAFVEDIKLHIPANMTEDDIKMILADSLEVSDNLDFEIIAENYDDQESLLVKDSDMSKDIWGSKSKVETQQVIFEDSVNNYKNQPITAEDNSDLTNTSTEDFANTRDLSDTKDRDSRTYEIEGFEAFVDNLSTNYEKPIVEFTNDEVRFYDIRDIALQLIEKIRVMERPGQTTMELQLYPEHLGKVSITVTSREGLMTAGFVVENDLAKEAVESQMIILKENLAEQGIKVDTIDVTVGGYTFNQNRHSGEDSHTARKNGDTGRKITFQEAVAMDEEPIDSDKTDYIMGTMGHSINYKA